MHAARLPQNLRQTLQNAAASLAVSHQTRSTCWRDGFEEDSTARSEMSRYKHEAGTAAER